MGRFGDRGAAPGQQIPRNLDDPAGLHRRKILPSRLAAELSQLVARKFPLCSQEPLWLARSDGLEGDGRPGEVHIGEGLDLLFASGALQYLPKTLGKLLGTYQRLPSRIVINTTAIHAEHEFFTVNSLGTGFCPYRVQTQAGLIRGLTAHGYRLRETWVNPGKHMLIPFHPSHSLQNYSGFCLDLPRQG